MSKILFLKNQILGTFFYMLYLVAMLQPILPLIEYNVNKEYIASVLCENRDKPELACNGKCYLNKKLKNNNNENSHKHSEPQIDLSKYPVSPLQQFSDVVTHENIELEQLFYYLSENQEGYPPTLFKPPIFSV